MDSENRPCFTDFALQEYVLGRLDPDVRVALEDHIEGCPQCAACERLIATETKSLREALRQAEGGSEVAPIDEELLALYLGGGLDDKEREEIETTLASSSVLRDRLNALRVELDEVLKPSKASARAPLEPEGQILRMPQRTLIPQKLSDLRTNDTEAMGG